MEQVDKQALNKFVFELTNINWFNPSNKEQAIRIAQQIDLECNNIERKALIPDAYSYHKKRLAVLKGKFTKLFNKDTNEWLKARIERALDGQDSTSS